MARDLGRQLRAVLDVGRVGDHGVDLAHALEQVGAHEADLEPQPRRVGARDDERVLADVGRRDREVGALVLERQRDRAAAGADVDHARALSGRSSAASTSVSVSGRGMSTRGSTCEVEVAKALDAR